MSRLPARARSRWWVAVAPVLVTALAAVGCAAEGPSLDAAAREVDLAPTSSTSTTSVPPRTVRLGIGDVWAGDPADAGPTSVGARVVAGLLFEGLTTIGANGEAEPALAERWFVSDDRLQWTFVLPEGLVDGTGEPITARDVKASLERIAARGADDQAVVQLAAVAGWEPFVAGDAGGAAGIVAIDATTLLIELSAPFEPLSEVLAAPAFGIAPPGTDGNRRTTGAFRLSATADVLEAVDAAAPVRFVELVRDLTDPAEALRSGAVDWVVLPDGTPTDTLPGDVLRQPLDAGVGVAVRLDDIEQRAAVMQALDPTVLVGEVADAGLDVSAGVEADATALPLELTVHAPEGALAAMGEAMAEQLTLAGADVTLVVLPPEAFAEAVADGSASIFPMVFAGGAWGRSALASLAAPGSVDDVFGLEDESRADLIAQLLADQDRTGRDVLLEGLKAALVDERLLLPVARLEVRVGLAPDLPGLRIAADGTLDLSGVAR